MDTCGKDNSITNVWYYAFGSNGYPVAQYDLNTNPLGYGRYFQSVDGHDGWMGGYANGSTSANMDGCDFYIANCTRLLYPDTNQTSGFNDAKVTNNGWVRHTPNGIGTIYPYAITEGATLEFNYPYPDLSTWGGGSEKRFYANINRRDYYGDIVTPIQYEYVVQKIIIDDSFEYIRTQIMYPGAELGNLLTIKIDNKIYYNDQIMSSYFFFDPLPLATSFIYTPSGGFCIFNGYYLTNTILRYPFTPTEGRVKFTSGHVGLSGYITTPMVHFMKPSASGSISYPHQCYSCYPNSLPESSFYNRIEARQHPMHLQVVIDEAEWTGPSGNVQAWWIGKPIITAKISPSYDIVEYGTSGYKDWIDHTIILEVGGDLRYFANGQCYQCAGGTLTHTIPALGPDDWMLDPIPGVTDLYWGFKQGVLSWGSWGTDLDALPYLGSNSYLAGGVRITHSLDPSPSGVFYVHVSITNAYDGAIIEPKSSLYYPSTYSGYLKYTTYPYIEHEYSGFCDYLCNYNGNPGTYILSQDDPSEGEFSLPGMMAVVDNQYYWNGPLPTVSLTNNNTCELMFSGLLASAGIPSAISGDQCIYKTSFNSHMMWYYPDEWYTIFSVSGIFGADKLNYGAPEIGDTLYGQLNYWGRSYDFSYYTSNVTATFLE